MIGIDVRSNARAFLASVQGIKDRDMKRAVAAALNRTAQGAQAEAVRKIRETYNVQARELRRGFTIKRAYAGKLVAVVHASGKNLNVIGFGARQTAKGVSFAIKAGERKTITGAFITTINGYQAAWMRQKKADGKLYGRLPIKAVTTVSVPGMFSNDVIEQSLRSIVPGRFERELQSAVRAIQLRQTIRE